MISWSNQKVASSTTSPDGLLEDRAHRPPHLVVEELGLLPARRPHHLEGEGHVGALVAEYPLVPAASPCSTPRERRKYTKAPKLPNILGSLAGC